jgi:hypothetical protein
MSISKKIISSRLLHNQYAILLDKSDNVTVSRVAKLLLNKPSVQTMTLGDAVRCGAWSTQNDTMSVEVQFRGAEIFKSPNNQYWAIISVLSNPRGQTCRELMSSQIEETAAARRAAAASERDTVYFGYGC